MKLFVDMDGVAADFDAHHEHHFGERPCKLRDNVNWSAIRAAKDFYLDIPPMADFFDLWSYVKDKNPTFLTGIPNKEQVPEAEWNKRAWIARMVGRHVPVIACRSKEKCLHARPGDILIDDWTKYKHLWEAQGGIFIVHTSAASTIAQLKALGI